MSLDLASFRKIGQTLLKPTIAVVMIVILLKSGVLKFDELKSSLTNSSLLLHGFVLLNLQTLFFALRWKFFVNQKTSFSTFQALRQTLIGYFFNFFVPGGVGGDIFKALDLSKTKDLPRSSSFSLIFLDRVLGLFAMILFSFVLLFLEYLTSTFEIKKFLGISALLLMLASIGLVFARQFVRLLDLVQRSFPTSIVFVSIMNKLKIFCENIASGVNRKNLLRSIVYSFFAQMLGIIFLFKVVTMNSDPGAPQFPFLLFFPLACFAFTVSALPVAPGGIGIGQASFYFIFASFDINVATKLVAAISLYQLYCLVVGLIGGFYYLKGDKTILTPHLERTKP